MKKRLAKLIQEIDDMALAIVMLDSEDVAGLGDLLRSLEPIEDLAGKLSQEPLKAVVHAMKGYTEELIMGEKTDIPPLEAGVSKLQEICRTLETGKEHAEDLSDVLAILGSDVPDPDASVNGAPAGGEKGVGDDSQADVRDSSEPEAEAAAAAPLGEEEREIILDFVAESLENLAAIEVGLIDLEQAPSDLETINSIFRPFHTVKGVSGFLNLNKINKLAHMAENLLDKARDGAIVIDGEIVDIVLDSVDLLKQMIENVRASLDKGTPAEGDVGSEALIDRIQYCIAQTEKGGKAPLGEMLVAKGAVSESDVAEALDVQKSDPDKKIGEIFVEKNKTPTKEVVSALREQKRVDQPSALQVKVDIVKLDNIVDMVGELAIAQSMLRQNDLVSSAKDRNLYQITNQLSFITSGLQNTAMSLRMVPIKNTFQRMRRFVRDLAKKAGKDVQLVMSGEDTEIDRNTVEEIYEPMVHMVRNSIDHGLETPDEREALGKAGQGMIHLKAYHRGGDIVIEIEDDGRGLDRDKILKKAESMGIIKEGEPLTDSEIDGLIFRPGFSTADKITDISGRGVGTDVVRDRIDKLRGRVDVRSESGQGSVFFLRLPLTLAIVDGMIVRVGTEKYIIPTLAVKESFRPGESDYHTVKGEGEMVQVRESLIPLVRLERLFGGNGHDACCASESLPWERLAVVVENQERKLCLLVDELLGQEEVVIKNLGGWLTDVKGIAGATIMGDGRVGLILDVAEIHSSALA